MPIFNYKAKKRTGETVSGVIEAINKSEVMEMIEDKRLIPLSVELKHGGKNKTFLDSLNPLNRVKVKDIAVFARQLSVMVSANVPIVQSLRIMVEQTDNEILKGIVVEVASEVEGGAQLSQALGRYSDLFDDFFISMIKSGETSGRLDEVLNYLADQREKDYDLMNKIRGAMIYPAFIVVGLIVVGIVMMVFVVPKLTGVLQELGGDLPLSTRILIGTSDFLVKSWWAIALIIVLATLGMRYFAKTDKGKLYSGWFKISMPIFGNLFKKIYLVRMTRALSTLLAGGVPLPQALGIAGDVTTNPVYKNLIRRTIKEVEDGHSVVSVFSESKYMPSMISHMMGVGEQTGRLDQILSKLTEFYTHEIDNLVQNLVSLIEPIIMIIMGVAVGVMVAAIIMPMYNMASAF